MPVFVSCMNLGDTPPSPPPKKNREQYILPGHDPEKHIKKKQGEAYNPFRTALNISPEQNMPLQDQF